MVDAQRHPPDTGGAADPSAHLHSAQREQTGRTHARPGLRTRIGERLRTQVSAHGIKSEAVKTGPFISIFEVVKQISCVMSGESNRVQREHLVLRDQLMLN